MYTQLQTQVITNVDLQHKVNMNLTKVRGVINVSLINAHSD